MNTGTEIAIERAEAPTAEIVELLAELDAELSGPYAADQRHALSVEKLFQPDVRFFVARLEGAERRRSRGAPLRTLQPAGVGRRTQ